MAFSKIILDGVTLMDVTGDTVDDNKLLHGITATKNDGTSVTGIVYTADIIPVAVAATASTSTTVSDSDITSSHYVINDAQLAAADISWTTSAGSLSLSGTGAIPAMTLYLAVCQ